MEGTWPRSQILARPRRICCNAADDREDFSVDEAATKLSEEVLKIDLTDLAHSKLVKASVGCLRSVVGLILELFDEGLHALNEVNLVLYDVEEANFDVIG